MILAPKDITLIKVYLDYPEFRGMKFKMNQAIKGASDCDIPITNEMITGFKVCCDILSRKLQAQQTDNEAGRKIISIHTNNLARLSGIFL